MNGNILYLDEEIIKRTIVRDDNRIILSGKNGTLTIFLNQYIPKKSNFFLHPIKYWKFKKDHCRNSSLKRIKSEDCHKILLQSFEHISFRRLSPEDVWKRIRKDILKSNNFQYSFISGSPYSSSKSFTCAYSYLFVLN